MRVSAIEVTPVSVPCPAPVRWRFGALGGVTSAIVALRTDTGLEGVGEAPGVPSIGIVLAALEFFSPFFDGEDPLQVRKLVSRAQRGGAAHFPYVANVALAALETALWDLCGKALGVPVHQLFGGLTTPSAPFYWHVNAPDGGDAQMVDHAREGLALGYRTLYVKGSDDVRADLETMRALRRAAGPDVALRLDPNEGWTLRSCLEHEDLLREVRLEFLEQPFEMRALADARALRERTGVPVAANQSAWLVGDVRDVLAARAADVVVTGLHQAGGLLNLSSAETLCSLAGVPLVRHSLCDLGIATAASLQLMATWPDAGLAHQTHLQLVEHDLLAPSLGFEAGRLRVPTGPGLGVELDRAALERYAKHFETNGEYRGYDPAAA